MKNLLPIILVSTVISCKKNSSIESTSKRDTLALIDSINAARTNYNDSIKALNSQNRFADLTGAHQLAFQSDGETSMKGTVHFTKTGRDEYTVKGDAKSGSNSLSVDGTIKGVSERHLNFEGQISQKINGSSYTRSKKTTFLDEGKGGFWRLQDKVNGNGWIISIFTVKIKTC